MRSFTKLFGVLAILFWFTNKSMGYVSSPIPLEAVDSLKAGIKIRLQEPARDTLPTMDLDQIIRDIILQGMQYFEQNYPQEVVNIVKPAYKSFSRHHPYGKFTDEEGKTFYTIGRERADRFYEEDIPQYGKILPPVLVYSPKDKSGDSYVVPLAFNDTIRFFAEFAPDTCLITGGPPWELLYMGYTGRDPDRPRANLTKFPPIDSVEADSIMRTTLAPGEEIISQRLFNMMFTRIPYWNFLIQTGGKGSPDTNIHWVDPVNREIH